MLKIISNYHDRQFNYRDEVPADVIDSQFDHLTSEDNDMFFKYRDYWYHISDFMAPPSKMFPGGWAGYLSDSFYSGVLIKFSGDCETFKVATFIETGTAAQTQQ